MDAFFFFFFSFFHLCGCFHLRLSLNTSFSVSIPLSDLHKVLGLLSEHDQTPKNTNNHLLYCACVIYPSSLQ